MTLRPLLLALSLALPSGLTLADTVSVAVAANVQYAFDDLARAFKQQTGIDAKGSFGSSGKLATQIANGAPFEVFLSADMEFPQELAGKGLTSAPPKPYALGTLVVWSTRGVDLGRWQQALGTDGVRKIAVANPKTAPYGREALNALNYYKLAETATPKLVYGDSIAQASQYIQSGVAELGFTAKSVVLAPELKGQGQWREVPKQAYSPIAQGAVLIRQPQAAPTAAATRFYDFLFSAPARRILEQSGYSLP